MLSGGSTVSTSLIPVAITLTAHVVPSGRFAAGSSTAWLVPEPLTVKVFGVPLGHWRVNELVEKVTASLKLTVMLVFTATLVAPLVGTVVMTNGAVSFGAPE